MTPTRKRIAGRILLALAVAGAIALAWNLGRRHEVGQGSSTVQGPSASAPAEKALYHCPMHPTMTSDRPADCPICGMRMVAVENDPSGPPGEEGRGLPPAGQAPIHVPAGRQQLVGVRTAVVRRAPMVRTVRTVGVVAADETRLHHIHTKTEGWVETLNVNTTGERVVRGQPLLTLYSPELLAAQQEHLLALKARRETEAGTLPEVTRMASDLLESSRRRLALLDLSPAQISDLESRTAPLRGVTLHAPISGYVTARNVTQGERIDPGMTLLDIADLSHVWVIASVYEYEIPFVRQGQEARVSLSYLPGRAYTGTVALVYPLVAETTRTVQVRLEFRNPDLTLKPGMYADVELLGDLGERLSVPESAVLSSGTRDLVFVARGENGFEPRQVVLGARTPDAIEVLEGLAEGESIVVSGAFLLDSESKLKSALETAAPPRKTP